MLHVADVNLACLLAPASCILRPSSWLPPCLQKANCRLKLYRVIILSSLPYYFCTTSCKLQVASCKLQQLLLPMSFSECLVASASQIQPKFPIFFFLLLLLFLLQILFKFCVQLLWHFVVLFSVLWSLGLCAALCGERVIFSYVFIPCPVSVFLISSSFVLPPSSFSPAAFEAPLSDFRFLPRKAFPHRSFILQPGPKG